MKVAIIDADLIGRKNHRFPNLACEKISAYYKQNNNDVILKTDYEDLEKFDQIFISKVFTDTPFPRNILSDNEIENGGNIRIKIGGTGFYFDKAPNLPDEIEHHMPNYHLYDNWIKEQLVKEERECSKLGKTFNLKKRTEKYKEYTDYSIGFLTRGCFRKCAFCVNQKYSRVFLHSPLSEFYDPNRKKICLLDDNFLGFPHWNDLINDLKKTNKSFKFKQGLDERILNDKMCKSLFSFKYDGDYTFAFDKVEDYDLIQTKLKLIKKYHKKKSGVMFYVLVGFESTDYIDIENCFKRIDLLFKYNCLPYIMRYQNKNEKPWEQSKYRSLYITIARWGNQPSLVKKMSFREFCVANQALHKSKVTLSSSYKAMLEFEEEYPKIANQYFDIKYETSFPDENQFSEMEE